MLTLICDDLQSYDIRKPKQNECGKLKSEDLKDFFSFRLRRCREIIEILDTAKSRGEQRLQEEGDKGNGFK